MTYSLDGHHLMIHLQDTFMTAVHVRTRSREQTRLASADIAQFLVLAPHAVHVRSRRTQIGDIAGKSRHIQQTLDLLDNGSLGAGLDELALMCGNRTEIAASEASPVRIDRIFDHVIRRNAFAVISRVRPLRKRKVPERIHIFL